MPITVVVGGQYGSEGKGKTITIITKEKPNPMVVRCGGPNAGHTTRHPDGTKDIILRQIPSAVVNKNSTLFISAGSVVDEDIIINEVKSLCLEKDRIIVDPNAVIITKEDRIKEKNLINEIGSTGTGTGAASARRLMRHSNKRGYVGGSESIREVCTVKRVAPMLQECLELDGDIFVEGTQGFGLSLYHSRYFPFVTGRDTTASGFLSECGLPPKDVTVIMVLRTFVIRVGGNSGPIKEETTWDNISLYNGGSVEVERTSVTNRLRRVGNFDFDLLEEASKYNSPKYISLMGIDRILPGVRGMNAGVRKYVESTNKTSVFLSEIERISRSKIFILGTGPGTFDAEFYDKT